MRILVTGDRNWSDHALVYIVLYGFKRIADLHDEVLYVIDGGAAGADRAARDWADDQGEEVESITIKAQWGKYGKAAGPIRNQKMLEEHDPEYVLAFHDDLANSKGTGDCVRRAKAAGITVYAFSADP